MHKVCTKCHQGKPLDDFPNEVKRKDGKYPWCRECLSDHRRERYVKLPRKVWIEQKVCSKCKQWKPRDQFKLYTGGNLHYRCIDCENTDARYDQQGLSECTACKAVKPLNEFYTSRLSKKSKQCIECQKTYHRQEHVKFRTRGQTLERKFGITLGQYDELREKQDQSCPICLKPLPAGYSSPVDHAHKGPNAGVIRAILHDRCNRFVVADHTDPEVLRRAADLIEHPLTDWFVPEEFVNPKKKRKRRRRK